MSNKRFAVLASTSGSVVRRVFLDDEAFRQSLSLVVTDRECGIKEFALDQAIPFCQLSATSHQEFSDNLLRLLIGHNIDCVLLFFSRLLKGRILTEFKNRIINFHPALLPAFPGLHGFDDAIGSGSLIIGSTVHMIDDGIDTGPVIQQSYFAFDPERFDYSSVRHRVFLQQCASLSQIVSWVNQDRLSSPINNRIGVIGGRYDGYDGFIPSIETKVGQRLAVD